jgi:hypothetical protein
VVTSDGDVNLGRRRVRRLIGSFVEDMPYCTVSPQLDESTHRLTGSAIILGLRPYKGEGARVAAGELALGGRG